jgi:excisionase family DNA binding protein
MAEQTGNTTTARRCYTLTEAAQTLSLCERTIGRMVAANKIKSVKVSARRRVIPATEIDRLLSGGA